MKTILLTIGLAATLALNASATVADWYSGLLNTTLADNSAAGSTFTTSGGSWSGTWGSGSTIENINVYLNISGGYNGDLYGYLVYNDGMTTRTEVLLSRIGGGGSAASGSGFGSGTDAGSFASLQSVGVRLSDGGSGNIDSANPGAGQAVTGHYTPDNNGEVNFAGTFDGLNSGGTWTLFLADLATGDQSTLVNWGLSVHVVPEPATWALIVFCSLAGIFALLRSLRRQPVA